MQDVALPGSEHRSKGRRQPIAAAAKKEETRGGLAGGWPGAAGRALPSLLAGGSAFLAPKCRTFELLGADGLCPVRVTRAWRLLPPSPRAADISLAGGSGAANGCCCTCAATESLRRDRISRSCGSQTGSRLCWVLRHVAALRSGCKMETVLGSLREGEERSCCRGAAVAELLSQSRCSWPGAPRAPQPGAVQRRAPPRAHSSAWPRWLSTSLGF